MNPEDIKHIHPKSAPDAPDPLVTEPPSAGDDSEALDLVAEVHTRVLDTVAGMEKLHDKADADFKATAQDLLAMHRRHEADLSAYLVAQGRDAQEDGSFFATVNRAVIEMRSWVDDISDNVMTQVKEGEKHVLEAYSDALEAAGQPEEARDMLSRQRAEIDAAMHKHAG